MKKLLLIILSLGLIAMQIPSDGTYCFKDGYIYHYDQFGKYHCKMKASDKLKKIKKMPSKTLEQQNLKNAELYKLDKILKENSCK